MTDSHDTPATKADLQQVEGKLGSLEIKLENVEVKLRDVEIKLCAYMDNIKDQIIRGFQLTEESIRKDSAHVDEVVALDTRLSRVEEQLEASE